MEDSRPYYNPSATNTLVRAQAGYTRLCGVQLLNGNAAIVYLQLFDAAATTDVTLGTTVPDKVIKCEASVEKDVAFEHRPRFKNGLVYAVTTGAGNSSAPGAVSPLSLDLA